MLRDDLPQMAKDATEVLGSIAPITIHRVEEVPKRKSDEQSNALQEGINVSHYICSQSKELIEGSSVEKILVYDYTDEIICMVSKFLEGDNIG